MRPSLRADRQRRSNDAAGEISFEVVDGGLVLVDLLGADEFDGVGVPVGRQENLLYGSGPRLNHSD